MDQSNFTLDTWLHVVDVTFFDCADGFDATERCFG